MVFNKTQNLGRKCYRVKQKLKVLSCDHHADAGGSATTPVNGGITVGNPTHDGQSSQGPDPGTDSSSCYPTEGGASTNPGCPDDPNGNFWNPGGGPDGSGNLNEVGDSNGDDENDSGDDEEEEGDDDDDNSDDKR